MLVSDAVMVAVVTAIPPTLAIAMAHLASRKAAKKEAEARAAADAVSVKKLEEIGTAVDGRLSVALLQADRMWEALKLKAVRDADLLRAAEHPTPPPPSTQV